jgi:hypothetical protein
MTTIVQTSYRPQIAAGLEGMIADMTSSSVQTRTCETLGGIPFGRVCSQGAKQGGCIVAGAAFIGVSVRDITLVPSPVDPLAADGYTNPLDAYGPYTNVALLTRGRIWLRAAGNIVPGNPLSYDPVTGLCTTGTGGANASGWIKFTKVPAAGETLVVNGVTVNFVAGTATGDDLSIANFGTVGDFVSALAVKLEASATAGLAALHFAADPPTPVGGGSGSDTILISDAAVGVLTKAITSGPAGMTKSGATLTGGSAASTALVGASWLGNAIAGQLAIASFGIQQ